MIVADLSTQFDTITRSAFRLEGLQAYDVTGEGESLRAFREGLPRPVYSVRTDDYLRRIALQAAAGIDWCRMRVVEYPLSEYVRWELLSYVESQAVGERVLLVDRALVGDLGPDFWLFDADTDQARAVLMHYDQQGRVVKRELITAADALAELAQRRARAEVHAVPLNVFLAQNGARE